MKTSILQKSNPGNKVHKTPRQNRRDKNAKDEIAANKSNQFSAIISQGFRHAGLSISMELGSSQLTHNINAQVHKAGCSLLFRICNTTTYAKGVHADQDGLKSPKDSNQRRCIIWTTVDNKYRRFH